QRRKPDNRRGQHERGDPMSRISRSKESSRMRCNIALIKVVVIVIALAVAAAAGRGPEAERRAPVMWLCLGIAALVGLTLFRRRPSLCSICDNPLRRTADEWKIDGWKR